MAGNLTLAIIKPGVLLNRKVGETFTIIEKAGFGIILGKLLQLRKEGAQEFYKEHKNKSFFEDLVVNISAGPVWVLVLAKDNAVEEWLKRINSLDENLSNAVHGSVTDHDARREINFFFSQEIMLAQRIETVEREPQVV